MSSKQQTKPLDPRILAALREQGAAMKANDRERFERAKAATVTAFATVKAEATR